MPPIGIDRFPKQGSYLLRQVDVCFDDAGGIPDPSKTIKGIGVREDAEAPGRMIIKLENGRYVLSTECHYSPLTAADRRN